MRHGRWWADIDKDSPTLAHTWHAGHVAGRVPHEVPEKRRAWEHAARGAAAGVSWLECGAGASAGRGIR